MWIKRTYGRSPGGKGERHGETERERVRGRERERKKVLPEAVCNQFDSTSLSHWGQIKVTA